MASMVALSTSKVNSIQNGLPDSLVIGQYVSLVALDLPLELMKSIKITPVSFSISF